MAIEHVDGDDEVAVSVWFQMQMSDSIMELARVKKTEMGL